MTTLREAAQQALEALEEYQAKGAPFWACDGAVSALKAALAEPVQEPVAWMIYTEGGTSAYVTDNPNDLVGAYRALALYTAPPQRKPLTEEQVDRAYQEIWRDSPDDFGPTAGDWIEAGIRYAERVHGIGCQQEATPPCAASGCNYPEGECLGVCR